MTTTRESEFEQAYKLQYLSEYGCGLGAGFGFGYGRGRGRGRGYGRGRGSGLGSLDSKKDLIDDDDS